MNFLRSMTLAMKKEKFLTNGENKSRFIQMLGAKLEESGCDVLFAKGDADLLIVQTTVSVSAKADAVLVGDDTDLLVLLCYYGRKLKYETYFMSEPKQSSSKSHRYVNINILKDSLGKTVCENILFVHAILGCDTTSRIYGIGKPVTLKVIQNNDSSFLSVAKIFGKANSSQKSIENAGEKAVIALYKGKGNSLDSLRLERFQEKLAVSKTYISPCALPPTSEANKYHSFRVYHQIQAWKGNELNPEKWGWKVADGKMTPLQTDRAPAPQCLLQIVRCSCKTECKDLRCGCRKQGLSCSLVCSGCKGVCANGKDLDGDIEEQ